MYNEEEHIESEFMKQHGASPFKVPDGYFNSFEDRLMKQIQVESGKKGRTINFVRILKPMVAAAACIALVYLVASTQFAKHDLPEELSANTMNMAKDDSTFNFSLIDESTLVNTIFSDDKKEADQINSDDMLAYLSSGLNEVQIYSEIQKK